MNVRSLASKARNWMAVRYAFLLGLAIGWFACVAWVLTIKFAPEIAVDLIAKVGALQ
jgi:hypothetical protein